MNWQKKFKTALVLETGGLVIAGAGSSVSLTGYSLPRLARPSLRERLNEFINTVKAALRRPPDYMNQMQSYYGPGLKEQFPRFNVEREMILSSIQQV